MTANEQNWRHPVPGQEPDRSADSVVVDPTAEVVAATLPRLAYVGPEARFILEDAGTAGALTSLQVGRGAVVQILCPLPGDLRLNVGAKAFVTIKSIVPPTSAGWMTLRVEEGYSGENLELDFGSEWAVVLEKKVSPAGPPKVEQEPVDPVLEADRQKAEKGLNSLKTWLDNETPPEGMQDVFDEVLAKTKAIENELGDTSRPLKERVLRALEGVAEAMPMLERVLEAKAAQKPPEPKEEGTATLPPPELEDVKEKASEPPAETPPEPKDPEPEKGPEPKPAVRSPRMLLRTDRLQQGLVKAAEAA